MRIIVLLLNASMHMHLSRIAKPERFKTRLHGKHGARFNYHYPAFMIMDHEDKSVGLALSMARCVVSQLYRKGPRG